MIPLRLSVFVSLAAMLLSGGKLIAALRTTSTLHSLHSLHSFFSLHALPSQHSGHYSHSHSQRRHLSRRRPGSTLSGSSGMWERLVALGAGFGGGSGGAGAGVKEEKDPGTVGGTKLRILKYPHPKLRAPNLPITSFDAALTQTATEMLMVMYAADGIGLAAPQVGVNMNLMVFNEKDDKEHEMILCNPEVVGASGIMALGEEGCLSFPQIYGQVQRNTWVEVSYQTLAGERVNRRFEGKPAIIFQHEFDHLDKVLFIDRLEEEDKKLNQKRLEKYVKKYGAGAAP